MEIYSVTKQVLSVTISGIKTELFTGLYSTPQRTYRYHNIAIGKMIYIPHLMGILMPFTKTPIGQLTQTETIEIQTELMVTALWSGNHSSGLPLKLELESISLIRKESTGELSKTMILLPSPTILSYRLL